MNATLLATRTLRAATTLRTDGRYEAAALNSALRAEADLMRVGVALGPFNARFRSVKARFHAADDIHARFSVARVSL